MSVMRQSGRSVRRLIAGVSAMAVLASGAACGGTTAHHPSLPRDPGTVTVAAGQATTLQIGGGADLIIPPGAMTPGAKVTATYRGAPDGAPASADATWSPIELVSDPPDAVHGLLRLEFPVPVDKLPVGVDPASGFGISTYDPDTNTWVPFDATYDAARHMMVAEIPHFSWWAPWTWDFGGIWRDVAQGFGQLTGARSGPANCTGVAPPWVRSIVGTGNGADIAIHSCAQSQGDVLDVEMVNNRPYGQILTYGSGVKWGWHDAGDSLEDKLRDEFVDSSFVSSNQLYIPPLGRASVGMLRPAANSASSWHIGPTKATVGTDLTFYVLGKLIDHVPLGPCVNTVFTGEIQLSVGALRDDLVAIAGCVKASFDAALKAGKLDKVTVDKLASVLGSLKSATAVAKGIELAGGVTWKIADLVADWVVNRGNPLGNGFSVFSKAISTTGSPPPPATGSGPPAGGSNNPPAGGNNPPPGDDNPPAPNRTAVVSYDQMRGGAPYWGRSSKGWQGFTVASNTITTVGVTWNDNNYTHGATLPGVTTRISLCTGVGSGADPCLGRIADGSATVNNTADTRIDFGDVGVTPGATYYVFYYQPSVDAGGWDLYWWNCPACSATGRQSALNSDQNQVIVLGYNR